MVHGLVRKTLTTLAVAALCLVFGTTISEDKTPDKEKPWIQLFNGKDLSGWTPKIAGQALGVNHLDTFRVENGVLKVAYDKYTKFNEQFGHLFYKESFSHYRLRIEYRFVGEQCAAGPGWALRNSGVMIHGQPPETMGKDQSFPVSIEVQFLGGNGKDPRPTGNLCTPGTHVVRDGKLVTRHCTESSSRTYHGEQWVTAEIEVRGSKSIKHTINDELVLSYSEPQYDEGDADARKLIKDGKKLIASGSISLQAESHPLEFRKVELQQLEE